MQAIARWPLRDMLVAYVECMKADMRADLRHDQLMWRISTAFGGDSKDNPPPRIPKLLQEPDA